jgi:hypothetical protein
MFLRVWEIIFHECTLLLKQLYKIYHIFSSLVFVVAYIRINYMNCINENLVAFRLNVDCSKFYLRI